MKMLEKKFNRKVRREGAENLRVFSLNGFLCGPLRFSLCGPLRFMDLILDRMGLRLIPFLLSEYGIWLRFLYQAVLQ